MDLVASARAGSRCGAMHPIAPGSSSQRPHALEHVAYTEFSTMHYQTSDVSGSCRHILAVRCNHPATSQSYVWILGSHDEARFSNAVIRNNQNNMHARTMDVSSPLLHTDGWPGHLSVRHMSSLRVLPLPSHHAIECMGIRSIQQQTARHVHWQAPTCTVSLGFGGRFTQSNGMPVCRVMVAASSVSCS